MLIKDISKWDRYKGTRIAQAKCEESATKYI